MVGEGAIGPRSERRRIGGFIGFRQTCHLGVDQGGFRGATAFMEQLGGGHGVHEVDGEWGLGMEFGHSVVDKFGQTLGEFGEDEVRVAA